MTFYALIEKIKTNEREDTNKTLVSVGRLKTNQIQSYLSERKADATVISNFLTTPSTQYWLTHQGDNSAPAILKHLAESAVTAYQYRGLLLIDGNANIRFTTSHSGMLTETGKALALGAMRERSPATFQIYFGDPSSPDLPVLDTFVPIMSPGKAEVVGMVVMRNKLDYLNQLIQTWPIESETAESLLVTKDGNDVLFLNELRFQKNTALKLRIPIDRDFGSHVIPTVEMLGKGHFGLMEGYDYLDHPTLAYNIAVPGTSWGMVVKMDVKEAEAHSQRLQRAAIIIALAFVVFVGIIVWLWWRKDKADQLANIQLHEAESRYRRLHESMRDAYVMMDMSGRLLEFNTAYLEMLGYSAEELLRLSYSDLTPEKWHALEKQIADEQIIFHDKSPVYEKEYTRKDGTVFPVELRTFLLRGENGQPEAMWSIVRDITERKRAEEELQRFFNLIPDLACIASTDGHFLKINSAWQSVLGFSEQELLSTPLMDLIHPDDRGATTKEVERQIGGEATIHFINRYRRKDGSYRWLEWQTTTAINNTLLYATARDITERKQTEELLRKSAEEIEDLYNHAPCGYHSLDKDGIIRQINDTELGWLGYTREEMIGKFKWMDLLTLASQHIFREDFPRFRNQGFTRSVEIDIVRKDGSTFTALVNASAIYDSAGNFVMSRSTVTDITERKRVDRQLQELSAHLQSIREEEKSRIAREIHDDLGGTLTALKMDAYWLSKNLPADKAAAPLLKRAQSILQLLDSAVGVTRRIITDLRPSILDDLGLLAALEWQAEQFHKRTGISCRVNCIEDKFTLDNQHSIALFRIFQETLTNVARHSGASRVEVEYHCDDEEVMLSISDNGCGLPEGHTVAPTSYGMRGMRERTKQLGGKIKFENLPGGGFSVTVILPLPGKHNDERVS